MSIQPRSGMLATVQPGMYRDPDLERLMAAAERSALLQLTSARLLSAA